MWVCDKAAQCRGIEPPKTRGKTDAAYDAVVHLLYSYGLMPGQQLSDVELSAKLNIGRTPVREALIRLAAEGKVISIPQKGYFTRPLTDWAIADSYAVAREVLAFALARAEPQAHYKPAPCEASSRSEPARRAEAIFTEIGQRASNCEMCKIIDKFCFCTHPLRVEITASEHSRSFRKSLATLTNAMPQLGKATSVVQSALMSHLDFEQRALTHVLDVVNGRSLNASVYSEQFMSVQR
ncbi:GntR family transcriptional regulator [Sinorhizobium americanum]|uniref:GntR family transcriptional regulator n=1 Tax=Sinorhizobium americanum TaxID=194963 RepID=UPI00068EB986|nr:GntR family transcriptional regulator [Sinorhizobium americanum]OAP43983.1 GntR family transcriptional regulator [Sinorhizobium americanum]